MPTSDVPVKPALIFLTPEQIQAIFEQAHEQADYVLGLYALVYPDWERIEKVDSFPAAGRELSDCIWKQAIAYDQQHHPECMAGGCWLNHGFSTDLELPSWAVRPCPVTYKEEQHGVSASRGSD